MDSNYNIKYICNMAKYFGIRLKFKQNNISWYNTWIDYNIEFKSNNTLYYASTIRNFLIVENKTFNRRILVFEYFSATEYWTYEYFSAVHKYIHKILQECWQLSFLMLK